MWIADKLCLCRLGSGLTTSHRKKNVFCIEDSCRLGRDLHVARLTMVDAKLAASRDIERGKELELWLATYGQWLCKRPYWAYLNSAVRLLCSHTGCWHTSFPTQYPLVLAAKNYYFRRTSHIFPLLFPTLRGPKDEFRTAAHWKAMHHISVKSILNFHCYSHWILRYFRFSQRFGKDFSLLEYVPPIGYNYRRFEQI